MSGSYQNNQRDHDSDNFLASWTLLGRTEDGKITNKPWKDIQQALNTRLYSVKSTRIGSSKDKATTDDGIKGASKTGSGSVQN
jgi:hypothetical protein